MNATSSSFASAASRVRARHWRLIASVVAVVVLFALFPPFRIVKLGEDGMRIPDVNAEQAFDPAGFAKELWEDKLQLAAAAAPQLAPILKAVQSDPEAALGTLARRVGVGSAAYYFARGSGKIVEIKGSELLVEVDGFEGEPIAIRTGIIFGNTVRDGCGLLEVNAFPGLGAFNAVSAELNRLVEERVLPDLRAEAVVDSRIEFAGCAKAPLTVAAGKPAITLVPVQAEVIDGRG